MVSCSITCASRLAYMCANNSHWHSLSYLMGCSCSETHFHHWETACTTTSVYQAVTLWCTLFSCCCYPSASQQNKCYPWIVLKRTRKNSSRSIWSNTVCYTCTVHMPILRRASYCLDVLTFDLCAGWSGWVSGGRNTCHLPTPSP